MTTLTRERFEAAATFDEYLTTVEKNRELWHGVRDRVRLPDELVEQAREMPGGWHLLALSEDWCGDAVNTLPVIAKFAAEAGWDLRVLGRDDNLDLMDAHLTNGRSRSIPIVIVYDADFEEVGWWGPRPEEIQSWVMSEGLAMSSPERYKVVRRWYAKDRGKTAIGELLDIVMAAT
ncbi:MAG: thioredoxin family protein [Gemmatimonadota bacterium]